MKKVALYTLGCKLNFSESSTIGRMFTDRGFEKVDFTAKPDVFIINTCSVTENADKKCRKIVREAKLISPESFVAIIGCYAQLKPSEISEIPGVDAVLGAAEKFRMFEYLENFETGNKPQVYASEIGNAKSFHSAYSHGDRTRTFLKVQDGCNYGCAFCTIPLARGKSRSQSISDVVAQAKAIAKTETREIVLTGVNIGDFGVIDGRRKESFFNLIQALDQVEGIDRFRISSIEPNLLTPDIISFVADSDRFVPHFHIPLQSGSDAILSSMNRRYDSALYRDRIDFIKKTIPDCCIGVDVITGFPGETEEEFQASYTFINSLDISYLHVFTYSERPNTQAIKMEQPVPFAERQRRSKMLRSLSEKQRRFFYESQLGTVKPVLFEADISDNSMFGFSDNYVRVKATYDPVWINEIRPVRLDSIGPDGTVEVVEPDFAIASV